MAELLSDQDFESQDRAARDQYAGLGSEISRYQGGLSKIDNLANARDFARTALGMSDDEIAHLLLAPTRGSDWTRMHGVNTLRGDLYEDSDIGRDLRGGDVAAYQSILSDALSGRVRGLADQQQSIMRAAQERRIGQLAAKEAVLKKQLEGTTGEYKSLIDKELERALTELGIGAGEARGAVGANLASRGLVDSSIGQRMYADLGAQEFAAKSKARLTASEEQANIQRAQDKTFTELDRQRERIRTGADLADLESAADLSFSIDQNQFKLDLERELADMELDADSKAFTMQLLSGLVGAGAQVGVGFATGAYSLGAPKGA